MKMKLISATVVAAFLNGCMATGNGGQSTGYGQNEQLGVAETGGCNTLIATGIGALAGAILDKNKPGRGAAIGGALGAGLCFAVNYQAQKVKSAEQTEKEFQTASGSSTLPAKTEVVSVNSQMSQKMVAAGSTTKSITEVELVKGTEDPQVVLQERLTMYTADGKQLQTVVKTIDKNATSGQYRSEFNIPMPEGVPKTRYDVKTEVLVNSVAMARTEKAFQVTWNEEVQSYEVALKD